MTPSSPPEAPRDARARGSRSGTAGTSCRPRGAVRTAGSACTRAPGTSAASAASRAMPSSPCLSPLARLRRHRGLSLEREPERVEQRAAVVVVRRRRHDRDVHAADLHDLVIVDLREDQLLRHPDRVVPPTIERLRIEPPEVADPWQRGGDQPVEELPHHGAAEGHLRPDRHPLPELEAGDRLPRLRDDRLLAGDRGEVLDRRLEHPRVLDGLADAHVDDDLLQARHLHRVCHAALGAQARKDLLRVAHLQPGDVALAHSSASHFRQIRTFVSPTTWWPTRVGLPQDLHTIWTFEMSMKFSVSMMPPCWSCCPPVERFPRVCVCFFARAAPSTMMRPSRGMTCTTRPVWPRSLPDITITLSSFLMSTPGIARAPPAPAYRRPDPPSTRMHSTSRAPVLSATRTRDSCWITQPSRRSRRRASASSWTAGASP